MPFWHWRRRQCFLENAWLLVLWLDSSESNSRVQSNTESGRPATYLKMMRFKYRMHLLGKKKKKKDLKKTISNCCSPQQIWISIIFIFLCTEPAQKNWRLLFMKQGEQIKIMYFISNTKYKSTIMNVEQFPSNAIKNTT